jgi:HSP20 family protein
MTLVRFNHPSLMNKLSNDLFFTNLFDSKLGNYSDCECEPKLDYHINDEDAVVNVEFAIPGLSKSDLEIELNNEILTVRTKPKDENDARTGFAALEFEKKFKVSNKISKDEISAHSENGVLYITLPKVSEAVKQPARTIEIA